MGSEMCIRDRFTTSVFTLPVQGSTPDEKWHHNVQNVIGRVAQVVSSDQVQLLLPDGEFIWVKMAGIKMPAGHDAFAANSRAWLASQINQQLVSADCVSIGKAIDSQPDGLHSRNIPVVECMVYPDCLLYTSPSPRDRTRSRMPSSA